MKHVLIKCVLTLRKIFAKQPKIFVITKVFNFFGELFEKKFYLPAFFVDIVKIRG